jgi:hypothetical protein
VRLSARLTVDPRGRVAPLLEEEGDASEAMQALSRGDVLLRQLVPGYRPTLATHQQRVRAVVAATHVLGARLTKAA